MFLRILVGVRTLPPEIAAADPRVVRPRDLRGVYAQPAGELADLADQGALLRLAHGYYAVVPEAVRHLHGWRPTVEAAALAIAQRDYGHDRVALMGMSAARVLGAVPRALGTAVVVVPKQRPAIGTAAGQVVFVTRDVDRLDVQRADVDFAEGWTTTPAQTALDLADRPDLGGFDRVDVDAATSAVSRHPLFSAVVLAELADRQRKRAPYEHLHDHLDWLEDGR